MAAFCLIDNKKIGVMTGKLKLTDGNFVCTPHWKKLGFNTIDAGKYGNKLTSTQILDAFNNNINLKNEITKSKAEFKANKAQKYKNVYVDNKNQKLLIIGNLTDSFISKVIPYSDIKSYDVNMETDAGVKKHGITRAVVGGVLAVPVGSVVGAVTGGKNFKKIMKLELIVQDKNLDKYHIEFLDTETKSDGFVAKAMLQQVEDTTVAMDKAMLDNAEPEVSNNSSSNSADEIREFKNLLDEGIISQDEFEAKKKEILGL